MLKQILIVLLCGLLCPELARGDGGTLRLSQRSGNYRISVFTAPVDLRAGAMDVSVIVQDQETSQVQVNIPVAIELQSADEPALLLRQTASTSVATNKLFQAAAFDLPRAGQWLGRIFVGDEQAALKFNLSVGPPAPAWLQLAPWVGWPFGVAALFLVHQRLVSRSEQKHGLKPAAP